MNEILNKLNPSTKRTNQFTHPWSDKELEFLVKSFKNTEYTKIANAIGRSYPSVQSKIRDLKLNKRINKHKIDSNFFKKWSSEMAYVLGFITADGNLQQIKRGYHIHIACDDIDVIEKIRYCLQSNTPIRQKVRFNGKTSYSLRFSDKVIFHDLVKLGVTPNKSLKITPPHIPKKFYWDYIRGFFDGDGSVCINSKRCQNRIAVNFYTASFNMANFLFSHIKKTMGNLYKGRIYTRLAHEKTPYYAIRLGHKASVKLFHCMYQNTDLYLERKYNKFSQIINYAA